MGRIFSVGASVFALSVIVLAACVGDEPSVTPTPPDGGQSSSGTSGASSGSSGTSGGSSGTSGASGSSGTSGSACSGDTVDACGASCTKCTAPTGGTVDCVAGACQGKCPGTQTICGNACVDTQGSATNCGACGHTCGAGPCNAGACQPFPVATGFTAVHGISASSAGVVIAADSDLSLCTKPEGCTATGSLTTIRAGLSQLSDVTVADTNVYFSAGNGDFQIVFRCPVAGCPAAGPDTIENIVNDGIGRVVASPTNVAWTRYQSYYGPYSHQCALPACSTNLVVRPQPATGPYSSDPTREMTVPSSIVSVGKVSTLWATGSLYNDATKQLRACGLAASCPTPTELDTGGNVVTALTYYNDLHYGASGASGGGSVIFSVSDATPGARTLLVSDAAGIADVAVDASGIYWSNAQTGKILRCSTLTGCQGSGQTLATGQTGVSRVRLDAGFVYWMTPTAVMKVAK